MMKTRMISLFLAMILLLGCAGSALALTRCIQTGDTGDEVHAIQERLIALKYPLDPAGDDFINRVYGSDTEYCVILFQDENDLLETGIVDDITWDCLFSDAARSWYVYMPVATGMPNEVLYEDGYALSWDASYAFSGLARSYETTYEAWEYEWNTEEYTLFSENGFRSVTTSPLSTFAADVDTSSYARLRAQILQGKTVSPDSVRIEEMLNYFRYDYASPRGDEPFGVTMELAQCPWNQGTLLLQIGLQAATVPVEDRPAHNLVFLIDTSGSMEGEDRLDLVKRAFLLLLDELNPTDTVSIVAYASEDRVVLEGTPAADKTRIMEALTSLEPRGGTNGTAGILRAYEVAEKFMVAGGVNRILLATDGDLNLGVTSTGDLARLIMEKKTGGVELTVMGFGYGNYKDSKLEALADYGDGNCWFIDTVYEARKALVTEAGGTFITVAKDVKLQLDFNPAMVAGYRLIGYEDRLMSAEDFADDTKDGGELGSGHRLTALYEIVPVGSSFDFGAAQSKYQNPSPADGNEEWLTLSIRAKKPGSSTSDKYSYPLTGEAAESLSDNMKFAAAVAETGMLLRESPWAGESSWEDALTLLRSCGSVTGDPYKEEFLYLVNLLGRGGLN